MVLGYMVSDTDLVAGKTVRSERKVVRARQEFVRLKSRVSSPKKRVKLWFLLAATVVLCTIVYCRWFGGLKRRALEFIAPDRLIVGGILYNPENPSAIVSREIVREGDTVRGHKVIKIYRDRIEFEKDGEIITRRVR